jgi:hypothetical protein
LRDHRERDAGLLDLFHGKAAAGASLSSTMIFWSMFLDMASATMVIGRSGRGAAGSVVPIRHASRPPNTASLNSSACGLQNRGLATESGHAPQAPIAVTLAAKAQGTAAQSALAPPQ